jgi:hypothetical protein
MSRSRCPAHRQSQLRYRGCTPPQSRAMRIACGWPAQ